MSTVTEDSQKQNILIYPNEMFLTTLSNPVATTGGHTWLEPSCISRTYTSFSEIRPIVSWMKKEI